MLDLKGRALPVAVAVLTAVVALSVLASVGGTFFAAVADTNDAFRDGVWEDESGAYRHLDYESEPVVAPGSMVGYGGGVTLDGSSSAYWVDATMTPADGFSAMFAIDWTGDELGTLLALSPRNASESAEGYWEIYVDDTADDDMASVVVTYLNGAGVRQFAGAPDSLSVGKHAVGVIFDGSSFEIFIDGASAMDLPVVSVADAQTLSVHLFARGDLPPNPPMDADFYYLGAGYEARIYDVTLSDAEMVSMTDTSLTTHPLLGTEYAFYDFESESVTGNNVADSAAVVMPIMIAVVAVFGFVGMALVAVKVKR